MTSQEEWRQIAYQRGLGERGISTSSIHNREAYDKFQRDKQEQERQRQRYYDSLRDASTPMSAGSSPRSSYSPPREKSPGEALMMVSLMVAAGCGVYMQSWYVAAAAFVATAGGIVLLVLFFATQLGRIVSYLLTLGILISLPILAARIFGNTQSFWTAVGVSLMALSPSITRQAELAGTVVEFIHKLIRILCFGFLAIVAVYFIATLIPYFNKA